MINKLLYSIVFGSLCICESLGQDYIDVQLKKPIVSAINSNYELKNNYLETDKNIAQINEIKGKHKPNISATGGIGYLNTGINSNNNDLTLAILNNLEIQPSNTNLNISSGFINVGINATQVIFAGLQIKNAIKAIEEKNKAYQNLEISKKESIAKDILQSYDQIMLLNNVDNLIDNSYKRLNKEYLKVQTAIKNGLAIPYDRERIKLAMLELESKKIEIDGSRKILYEKIAILTHLPIEELKEIKYDLFPINLLENNYSVENKQEIKALKNSVKAYEYLYKKEKGAGLPQVFAFAKADYLGLYGNQLKIKDIPLIKQATLNNNINIFPFFIIGIGAKWEIFNGNQHKYKLQQAKNDILINENKLKDTEEKLNLLLSKNKIDYEVSIEKIKVSEQQNKVANANLEIATKRFEEGLIDVTERLASENEFYKANLGFYTQILEQRFKSYDLLITSGLLLNQILD